MSGTTGYPWVDGQFLKAADLNAAIAGSSGGTGAVSSVGAIAIAFGGAPPADVNAVLALDPTTLVLYVRIGSGWSPAGRLVSLTASPLATSVPFGWSFTTSGHVLVPTSAPTAAPTTAPTTSPSALSALSATGPTGARGQASSADGPSALVSIPAPRSSGVASATSLATALAALPAPSSAGHATLSPVQLVSDSTARTPPTVAKPGYLQPITDPVFGTKITRISGDPGTSITNIAGGVWGSCARHHYSLDQAWNADQSLLYLDTNSDPDGLAAGGSPTGHIFLDGSTYVPQFTQSPPGSGNGDIRWHVSDPTKMYYVHDAVFGLWTPSTNATAITKTFTGYSSLLFGKYKGFYSNNGDVFVFQGTNASAQDCVFAYKVSTDTKYPDILYTANSSQISPLGTYVVIVNANDDVLIYDVQGNLVQTWTAPSSGSGSPSHADLAIDENGDEVLVGVGKGNPYGGRIVKRRLSDGAYTALTPSSPQNYGQHVSCRNTGKAGWAFASYPDNGSSYPLYGLENIAIKLDGTSVLRLCNNHATNTQSDYYSQPQSSPSQTGDRVIFASNWDDPNGTGRPVQAYICDLRATSGLA